MKHSVRDMSDAELRLSLARANKDIDRYETEIRRREVKYFPQTPETARRCVHRNLVWFGHECGYCDDAGEYIWETK